MDINAINSFLRASLHNIGVSEDVISSAHFNLAPLAHADLTSSVAFTLTKTVRQSPREIAEKIVVELKKNNDVLRKIGLFKVVGAGYINVIFTDELIWEQSASSFHPRLLKPNDPPVIVEYSSPNVAKPLGIGHMRSTIIGEALARIIEWSGSPVVRLNHPGDWGTQFGKLLVMLQDNPKALEAGAVSIHELQNLYVRFHELAKSDPRLEDRARKETAKLQQGDTTNRTIWQKIVVASYEEFDALYKQLDVHFDEVRGESAYEDDLPTLVGEALGSGVATRSEGAVIISFQEGLPPMMIQKSDGAYLYATTDLAAARYRVHRYAPRAMLYVVANQQSLHFEQLKSAVERLGIASSHVVEHVKFGMLLGPDRKKLSTREGTSIGLSEVLEEATTRARAFMRKRAALPGHELSEEEVDRIAPAVGIGALKYQDLSQQRLHDVILDWDRMMSLSGNSAPYLQYSIVRMESILRKAGSGEGEGAADIADLHPLERVLLRMLVRFPWAVDYAAQTREPHRVAEYAYALAGTFHQFYEEVPVLDTLPPERSRRLELLRRAAATLTAALGLLGIRVPEKM